MDSLYIFLTVCVSVSSYRVEAICCWPSQASQVWGLSLWQTKPHW